MVEFIKAFLLIFITEMGDKTQIIAMTFASQYKIKDVLTGVVLGVILNHGLAIVLGNYISKIFPVSLIQILGGLLFVCFGILSLKDENMDKEEENKKFNPIFAVALAFFIGEFGDKTQLTAMTLGAEGQYPLLILMGTTLGMIGTSSIGILIGSKIEDKLPDMPLKILVSIIFVLTGSIKLYKWLPYEALQPLYILAYTLGIFFIEIILIRRLIYIRKYIKYSPMKEIAASLYMQNQALNNSVENICLGENKCGPCSKSNCIIGYTRNLLENAQLNQEYYVYGEKDMNNLLRKDFDTDKVVEALALIIDDYVKYGVVLDDNFVINKVRNSLEMILFKRPLELNENLVQYINNIYEINRDVSSKLKDGINL